MKILNRIVTFLLGAAVFPALLFRILLRAVVSVAEDSSIYKIISAFSETIQRKMEITLSVKQAVEYWQDGKFSFGGMDFSLSKIPAEMLITKNWLIAAAVLIVLTLIIALTIMGCALFTKAHKTVMSLSAGAILCLFASVKCFGKFAAPFVDGSIDLGALLGKSLIGDSLGFIGNLGNAALQGAIKVDILQLGNAVFTMGIIFFIILMWTLAYYITLPEKERKALSNKKK